jgi:hypothetical protein
MKFGNLFCVPVMLLIMGTAGDAATFRFDTDPFAGSTALTTPGRQVVAGESSISFSTLTDLFSLESTVFGVGNTVQFFNGIASGIPTGGVNVVILRTFDDDANTATAFGAGNAANLIASQITTPGPGFFMYFNQGLDLPRLVFSTDLNDNTADLKILFRMTNLTGQAGRDGMANFTASNFAITTVPEPSTFALLASAALIGGIARFRRRRRASE